MMDKQPRMNPEVLKEGVAVCQKKCEAWSKETAATDKGTDVKIKCALMRGDDKEVHPRPVCLPWVNLLLKANAELSIAVSALRRAKDKLQHKTDGIIDRLKAEIGRLEKSGLEVRGELSKAVNILRSQETRMAQLEEDMIVEDMLKQRSWDELKKVQNYRKGKNRHEEKLGKIEEARGKLKMKVDILEKSNKRLTKEDISKTNIMGRLNARIERLVARVEELQPSKEVSDKATEEAAITQ